MCFACRKALTIVTACNGEAMPKKKQPLTWGEIPTAQQVRLSRQAIGLTQEQAASLVFYRHRTAWAAIEQGRTQMDPARWALFLVLTRLAPLPDFP